MTLTMTMLPARDGDCLVLSFGEPPKRRHIVVDGGRAGAYAHLKPMLAEMAKEGDALELLVLTHIDADHIEGVLSLANDPELPLAPRRVWYNGYKATGVLAERGERQGDALSTRLAELKWPLNEEFTEKVACVEGAPDPIDIGGATLRLLSPDLEHLRAMNDRWRDWRAKQPQRGGSAASAVRPVPIDIDPRLLARPGDTDKEKPNGSSIAFVLEHEGRRVLLTGDAHPDALAKAMRPLAEAEGGRYRVDVLKVSHHGSRGNTTSELVELLDCRRFAFSSNGDRHGHPDPEAVSRLLVHGPPGPKVLMFNYRTKWTRPWENQRLRSDWDYMCSFPPEDRPGRLGITI